MGQNKSPWPEYTHIFYSSKIQIWPCACDPSVPSVLLCTFLHPHSEPAHHSLSLLASCLFSLHQLFWEEAISFSVKSLLSFIDSHLYFSLLPSPSSTHIFFSIKLTHNSSRLCTPEPSRYGAFEKKRQGLLQFTNKEYQSCSHFNETSCKLLLVTLMKVFCQVYPQHKFHNKK